MFIKLIYKSQTKKLVFNEDLFRFEVLEQKAIKLFNLHGQRLLLYYIDNDQESIAIMEDKDIRIMTESFPSKRDFYDIHIQISENVLYDFRNIEILKRSYLVQLKRKYLESEEPNRRELQKDLNEIKEHLELKRLEPQFIGKILEYLDSNMGLLIMEQFMSRELENFDKNFETKVFNIVNQITDISISSISCSQHTESSFMTKSDKLLSPNTSKDLSSISHNQSQGKLKTQNRSFVQETIGDSMPEEKISKSSFARHLVNGSENKAKGDAFRSNNNQSSHNNSASHLISLSDKQSSRGMIASKVEAPPARSKNEKSKTIFNKFTIFCQDLKDKIFERPTKTSP